MLNNIPRKQGKSKPGGIFFIKMEPVRNRNGNGEAEPPLRQCPAALGHTYVKDRRISDIDTPDIETPPQTWGKLPPHELFSPVHGNTPPAWGNVHVPEPVIGTVGNTPTDVGKALNKFLVELSEGNTPTGVGKALTCGCGLIFPWKHPHGRGEGTMPFEFGQFNEETPPRAWGRPPFTSAGRRDSGC